MQLIRFVTSTENDAQVGVLDGGEVYAGNTRAAPMRMSDLLRMELDEIREWCLTCRSGAPLTDPVELVGLLDGRTDVWGAGVTYERSRAARVEESEEPSIYERVYSADRPELFYKCSSWNVVGSGSPVYVRKDATSVVPEPELALILNSRAELVGYSVGNDMTARCIEAQNPLYLPQAKVWTGSCALGPGVRPAWEVENPLDLRMEMTIERGGQTVFHGGASTSSLRRRFAELVDYLFREMSFPDGVALLTGTSIVPEPEFSLIGEDIVTVTIEGIGSLANPVALPTS